MKTFSQNSRKSERILCFDLSIVGGALGRLAGEVFPVESAAAAAASFRKPRLSKWINTATVVERCGFRRRDLTLTVPWEEHNREIKVIVEMSAGSAAMHPLGRAETIGFAATKGIFVTAFGFATYVGENGTRFEEELKASAREQIEFMLSEDEDMALVAVDEEVKSLVQKGLSEVFSSFTRMSSSLIPEATLAPGATEVKISHALKDLEWMSNILTKINLMKEFVILWLEISPDILEVIEDPRLGSLLWGYKLKLLELMGKVLDAVAYGNVILPAILRVKLLRMWLPYIRKMKPLLDWKSEEEKGFGHQMDQDLCQSTEGAVVSLVSALPSNDQAEILADWLRAEQVQYPDLAEAFEIWCYRSKSARRRLVEGQAPESDEKDPTLGI